MHLQKNNSESDQVATALPTLNNQTPFQPEYMPVLIDTVNQLRAALGSALHSVYLYGSVAQRKAVWGYSDLNITVVLNRNLNSPEESALNTVKWRITTYQPKVPSLDLRVGQFSDVVSIGGIFEWGFWLKHCCVCLYGDDLSTRFGCFEPSWDVAKAMNGDIKAMLADYRQKIMTTKVVKNYLEYCQFISKKMLRSCFALVMHREKCLAHSLSDCADIFLRYYPEKNVEIERLFTLIEGAQVPKRASLFMIEQFGGWIVAELDKIERKIG
ncbi:MAG: nucleotidyltransferase domain-containing protein [Photobacterium frigidiphilum]|uniref:nucleotidyltransferase domain-containing protein n=1 Tax=Photobacterium frigidiphilum TaxID=264736 RepID=UPI0030038496